MPYSDILKRAFEIVRREPALWVMGFILALFGGGGGRGSSFNWNTGSGDWPSPGTETPTPGETPIPDLPTWVTPENMVILAITLGTCLLLLAVVSFVIRGMVLTGLIHGTERAAGGIDVRWRDLWRVGWSRKGWRILGMQLLLALPTLLLLLVFLVPLVAAGVALFNTLEAAGPDPNPAAIFGGAMGMIATIFCLVLVLALMGWALELIGNYAARAIVLQDQPTMAALRSGWQLLRGHPLDSIVFSLILGVIGIIIGLLLGFIIILLAFVVGLPIFFLLVALELPLMVNVGIGLLGLLLLILLGSALSGPLLAYYETAWTLVWQHFNPSSESAIPVAPEPTLI